MNIQFIRIKDTNPTSFSATCDGRYANTAKLGGELLFFISVLFEVFFRSNIKSFGMRMAGKANPAIHSIHKFKMLLKFITVGIKLFFQTRYIGIYIVGE